MPPCESLRGKPPLRTARWNLRVPLSYYGGYEPISASLQALRYVSTANVYTSDIDPTIFLIPLRGFEAGGIIVRHNKVTGEGEQILDDIGALADYDGLPQSDIPRFKFDQFPVLQHADSIFRIQIAQKYLPIANAYLGMLFTGNRGIKINMALSTQYVCPAFEDVDIQLRISLHRLSLIASQEPAIGMLPGPESIWRTC